jgi:uronate dehydrogenase
MAAVKDERVMNSSPPDKPVLLTGASGALGRVIVSALGDQGWPLQLTDRVPFPDALPAGSRFTLADLSDGPSSCA